MYHSPSLHDNEEALCQAYGITKMDNELELSEIMSFHNMMKSAKDCTKGVNWKYSVQSFTINRLQWVASLYNDVQHNSYKSMGFCSFYLMERGKLRHIQSVHISERCVQKCLNENGIKQYVEPTLIYDNGASRVGKGTEFSIKRLRQHLSSHYRKHRREGGILIADLHDYFNSIPHDRLLPMLENVLPDDIYTFSRQFIDCFGDVGLGLGSEISQIGAIFYTSCLDHYIKEQLHIKGYGRYMDDFYLIHEDIDYLKECLNKIILYLNDLGLNINPKTYITRFDGNNSFVFLKRRFRVTPTGKIETRLLRQNITKRRKVLKRQCKQLKTGKGNLDSVKQSYQSWRGYANKWDSRRSVSNMDRLYYSIIKEVNYELAK